MKHILSYGGGVCSSAMFLFMLDNKMPIDLVIHADTGEEKQTTHNTIKQIKKIAKDNNVEFVITQSDKGNLYDYYFNKKAVMSYKFRDCTSKFKISPIRKYLRTRYGKKERFKMYIGLTSEEFTRMKKSDVQYIKSVYPLVSNNITRDDCKVILNKYNVTASKSACKGCIYTKTKEWVTMLKNDPEEFNRHVRLEKNCSRYPEIKLNPSYKLEDLKKKWKDQTTLKDLKPNCDVSGSCFL